jgi:hypothetical protein
MKVKWTEYKTNEVLEIVQEKRMLIETIRERQKIWVGHVLRGDSLLRVVWEGGTDGGKEGGRKTEIEAAWMIRDTEGRSYKDLKRLALDRG